MILFGSYWDIMASIGWILGYLSIGILEWCRSWVAVSQGGSAKLRSALPSLRSHPNGSACSSRPGLWISTSLVNQECQMPSLWSSCNQVYRVIVICWYPCARILMTRSSSWDRIFVYPCQLSMEMLESQQSESWDTKMYKWKTCIDGKHVSWWQEQWNEWCRLRRRRVDMMGAPQCGRWNPTIFVPPSLLYFSPVSLYICPSFRPQIWSERSGRLHFQLELMTEI